MSDPARMSPKLLIGHERDILVGSLAVKLSQSARMSLLRPIRVTGGGVGGCSGGGWVLSGGLC